MSPQASTSSIAQILFYRYSCRYKENATVAHGTLWRSFYLGAAAGAPAGAAGLGGGDGGVELPSRVL